MSTVVILGAGATKACGGPLTNEILPTAFSLPTVRERQVNLELIDAFLVEHFNVPVNWDARQPSDFPGLPLLMSLIDIAIDRRHAFGANWPIERLQELRPSLELLIFAVIDHMLMHAGENHQRTLLQRLSANGREPNIISLNYDILADNALIEAGLGLGLHPGGNQPRLPDYGCDVSFPSGEDAADITRSFGRLLKLHGSLNWHYCPNCHRLELGVTEDGFTEKIFHRFVAQRDNRKNLMLRDKYRVPEHARCATCDSRVRPVLISPSVQKDYRNPHIAEIWYEAEKCLRSATRAVFIGYSLPDDDVQVIYLLKKALHRLSRENPAAITIVEYDPANDRDRHPAWQRFRALFGDRIGWHGGGLQGWLQQNPVLQ